MIKQKIYNQGKLYGFLLGIITGASLTLIAFGVGLFIGEQTAVAESNAFEMVLVGAVLLAAAILFSGWLDESLPQ